jgi:hypothetical protein
MEQEDRGAQKAQRTADHHSDYRQLCYRFGYLHFQSRPYADSKQMGFGLKDTRYIVHRPFNQGWPIRIDWGRSVKR